jgi:hypothetical protein
MRGLVRAVRLTALLTAGVACLVYSAAAQPAAKSKAKAQGAKPKAKVQQLDPWNRPEGPIVDQTARFYVWYDSSGWHIRSTAKGLRTFHGTVRVKDAQIKSCVPVGLSDGKQKGKPDAWRVNDQRSELTFRFRTAAKSDGFDIGVEGDGTIEFELAIDGEQRAQAIFVGEKKRHPQSAPFVLPAKPAKSGQ